MTTRYNRIIEIDNLIKQKSGEPLADFVLSKERDDLVQLREENIAELFSLARQLGVRFIYVGRGEIAGCEDKRDSNGRWVAMWEIAEKLGFPGRCGNTDQYQCQNSCVVFPSEAYGAWDLKLNKKLTEEEAIKKNFRLVVDRNKPCYNGL